MKQSTKVFLKLENKGKPNDSATYDAIPVKDVIMIIAKYLIQIYMGNKIVITIGRNASSIREIDNPADSLTDELTSLLDQASDEDESVHNASVPSNL